MTGPVAEMVWSPRLDRVAEAIAEKDGWVWRNLDHRRRARWLVLAQEALLVIDE